MKELTTIGLLKNEEREESEEREERVTPNIGVTPEEFYVVAIDACSFVASRWLPVTRASMFSATSFTSLAPATRAAIALGLRNTLREIEAQATDEARVAEEKAAKGVGLEPRGFDRATLDALVFSSHPGVKGARK